MTPMGRAATLWTVFGFGAVMLGLWFAITRTPLLLAYGPSGNYSLSQVQGFCDSGPGQFARALSARSAAECASVDSLSMWLNAGAVVALVLTVACAAALFAGRRRAVPFTAR